MSKYWILIFLSACLKFSLGFSIPEKIHPHVFKDSQLLSQAAVTSFQKELKKSKENNKQLVVIFTASNSFKIFFQDLVALWEEGQLDLSNVICFSQHEYVGLHKTHPKSSYYFLEKAFYNLVKNGLTIEKLSKFGLKQLSIEDLSDNLLKLFSLDQINQAILILQDKLIETFNELEDISYNSCEQIYWKVLKSLKEKDEIFNHLDFHIFNNKVLPIASHFIKKIQKDLSLRSKGLKTQNIYHPLTAQATEEGIEKTILDYKTDYYKFSNSSKYFHVAFLATGKESSHIGYNVFTHEDAFNNDSLNEEEKTQLALTSSIRVVPISEKSKSSSTVNSNNTTSNKAQVLIIGLAELLCMDSTYILAHGLSNQYALHSIFSCKKPTYKLPASLINFTKNNSACFYIDELAYGQKSFSQKNLRSFYQEVSNKDPSFMNIYYHNTNSKTLFEVPSLKQTAVTLNPFSETIDNLVNLVSFPTKNKILFFTKSPKAKFHFVELLKLKENIIKFLPYKSVQKAADAIQSFHPDIVFFPSELRKSRQFIPSLRKQLIKQNFHLPVLGIYYNNKRKTNECVLPLSDEVIAKKVNSLKNFSLSQSNRLDLEVVVKNLAQYYQFHHHKKSYPNENFQIYRIFKKNDFLASKKLSKQIITFEKKTLVPKGFSSLQFNNKDKVIIVSPHPNDAEISMGGFIHECQKASINPVILNATPGYRAKILKKDLKNSNVVFPEPLKDISYGTTFEEIQDKSYKTMIREFESLNALKFLNPSSIVENLKLPFYENKMLSKEDRDTVFEVLEKHLANHNERIFIFFPREDDLHPTNQMTTVLFLNRTKAFLEAYPEKDIYIGFYRTPWTGSWNLYHYNSQFGSRLAAIVGREIIPSFTKHTLSTTSLGGDYAERFFIFDIFKPGF